MYNKMEKNKITKNIKNKKKIKIKFRKMKKFI